jgi:hypothetical protein
VNSVATGNWQLATGDGDGNGNGNGNGVKPRENAFRSFRSLTD